MTDQPGAEAESGDSGPTENPPTAASPSEVARDESQPQTQTSGSFPSDHKQTNEPSVSAELAATQHSLDATKKALSDSLAKHEAYEALLSDALNKLSSARKEKGDAIEAAKKAAELAKVVDAALKEVNAIRGKLEKSETERKLALADRVLADSARIAAEKERQEAVEARKLAEARLEQFSKTHDSPTSLNGTESIPRLEMELQAAISDRDDAIRELEEANTERDLAWIERDEVKRTMEDLKSSWEKERKALTEKLDAANAKIAELETRLTAGLSPESTDPQPSLASPTTPSSPTIPNPFDSNMNVNAELAAAKVAHGSQIEALQIQLRALEKQRSELEAVTKKQGEERRALAAEVGRLSRQIGRLVAPFPRASP